MAVRFEFKKGHTQQDGTRAHAHGEAQYDATHHHASVAGAADDGGENRAGRVIASEAGCEDREHRGGADGNGERSQRRGEGDSAPRHSPA